ALESARQTGHVAGLAILDPSSTSRGELDCDDIKRLMEERLPLLPPLRWRLTEVPFGLDYPYWLDDPDFDPDFHVREPALPRPGELEMLSRGLLGLPRYPVRLLRSLPAAVPNIEDTPFGVLPGAGTVGRLAGAVRRTLGGGDQTVERKQLAAPKTSFNGRISPHRRFAFGQLSLDAVKAVKNAHGCTVNDVVVAICASAVRRWLVEHDELPDGPLVAQIPISGRRSEQAGTFGTRS